MKRLSVVALTFAGLALVVAILVPVVVQEEKISAMEYGSSLLAHNQRERSRLPKLLSV